MENIKRIIEKIEKKSERRIENKALLKKYIAQSISGKNLITFYNWECPPRTLSRDQSGKIYINYDANYNKIFRGEKLDQFTEIPRVVGESNREIRQLKFLKSLGLNFRFVKLIADTNAYYITPTSLKIMGEKRTKKIFKDFKNRIRKIMEAGYPQADRVYLFSELMKPLRKEYEKSFRISLEIQKDNWENLVTRRIWQEQLARTKDHIGINRPEDKDFLIDFSRRVVATYGAEGIVFDLLSRTRNFSNPVWLNIEEVDYRTVAITNCLRKKKKLGKLPMVFLE